MHGKIDIIEAREEGWGPEKERGGGMEYVGNSLAAITIKINGLRTHISHNHYVNTNAHPILKTTQKLNHTQFT